MKQPQKLSLVALIEASLLLINLLSRTETLQQDGPLRIDDNQLSVPEVDTVLSSQPAEPETTEESKEDNLVSVYERVVQAGSNVTIGCPHFVLPTRRDYTTTWSRGTTLARVRANRAEFTSERHSSLLGPARVMLEMGQSRVKWFRNHVPLVNLNHLHYGCCEPSHGTLSPSGNDAQITTTTIKRAPKLNQTTELSDDYNMVEQKSKRGTRSMEKDEEPLWSELHGGPAKKIAGENANELAGGVATRRKGSNLRQLKEELCVNKFGELIINGMSEKFAGKYTCLALGKQSDVLLHVVVDDEMNSLIRHRRTFAADMITNDARRLPASWLSQQSQPEETKSLDSRRNEHEQATDWQPGSRQSVTGSELRTGTSAFPVMGPSEPIADHKSGDWRLASGSSLVTQDAGAVVGRDVRAREKDQSASNGMKEKVDSVKWRRLDEAAKVWRTPPPLQSVRLESIQLSDLKLIPGLIYSEQKLHCPIWRSASFWRTSISSLVQTLCASSSSSGSQLAHLGGECQKLLGDFFFSHLFAQMDELKSGDNCNTSILELTWLKDGKQLQFDSTTGRGAASSGGGGESQANLRLINFCDQLDDDDSSPSGCAKASVEQKKSSNERDGDRNSFEIEMLSAGNGPISGSGISASESGGGHRFSWMCPSIGRTLEIDGVRQDSAGHFSCAFKLNTFKLNRYILDMRHTLELQQHQPTESIPVRRAHNISSDDEQSVKTKLQLPVQPGDASTEANETQSSPAAAASEAAIEVGAAGLDSGTGNAAATERNRWINLSKLITKGLEEQRLGALNRALTNHTTDIAQFENSMAIIQTFSFTVLERSAKTCDLWSTISQASEAYSRRKWLNFKRLKWLNRRPPTAHSESKHEPGLLSSSPLTVSKGADSVAPKSLSQLRAVQQNANSDSSSIGPAGTILADGQSLWLNPSDQLVDDGQVKHQQQQQQEMKQFISNHERPLLDDKWRLNNADDDGDESDITSSASLEASFGAPTTTTTVAHETPFNYANERRSAKRANKNGIMGIGSHISIVEQSRLEAKRSSTTTPTVDDSGAGDSGDISSTGEIKELITQIGGPASSSSVAQQAAESNRGTGQQNESVPWLADQTAAHARATRQAAPHESHMMTTADDGPPSVIERPVAATTHGGDPTLLFNQAAYHKQLGSISQLQPDEPAKSSRRRRRWASSATIKRQKVVVVEMDDDLNGLEASRGEEESQSSYYLEGSDGLDDDLMWIAGQYLYVEVKAVAGSALFGAEVSVEWSNERINGSTSFVVDDDDDDDNNSLSLVDSTSGSKAGGQRQSATKEPDLDYVPARDTSPFATIDVIPGQNLHLQCTAHALGRLPEVKWYKLIADNESPQILKVKPNLARKIDRQLYWPLEELDLLRDEQSANGGNRNNFVQSQSTTLFNNLVNQTFTLVSNLQLSANSDTFSMSPEVAAASRQLPQENGQNLFACIVDADVRHSFVTIGVNFPAGRVNGGDSRTIPIEISKRLQAKALFERNQAASRGKSREPRHLLDEQTKPSAFVGTTMMMLDNDQSIETDFWLALSNRSNQQHLKPRSQDFPSTATTLSVMIVVAFGSLLGLVFLTLKSYQRLTSMQFEYSLDVDYDEGKDGEFFTKVTLPTDLGGQQSSMRNYASYSMIEDDDRDDDFGGNEPRCACQLSSDMMNDHAYPGHARQHLCSPQAAHYDAGSSRSQTDMTMMTMITFEQSRLAQLEQTGWRESELSPAYNGPESGYSSFLSAERNEKIEPTIMVDNPLVVRDEQLPQYITSSNCTNLTTDSGDDLIECHV